MKMIHHAVNHFFDQDRSGKTISLAAAKIIMENP